MATAAGDVKIILSAEAASFSAALDKAKQKLADFGGSVKASSHATVSSMQASSAAIRTLEGGMTNNIRAVERFISTIPGVGKALQAIFPAVEPSLPRACLSRWERSWASSSKRLARLRHCWRTACTPSRTPRILPRMSCTAPTMSCATRSPSSRVSRRTI